VVLVDLGGGCFSDLFFGPFFRFPCTSGLGAGVKVSWSSS